ncbi:MAG TPA: hypothetical protein VJM74_03280 [Nitrososphaeraceae archaeon]|nr:hypothetical protein [Nitrososphaeraceae archaeon]
MLLQPRDEVPLRSGPGFPGDTKRFVYTVRFMCLSDTNDPSYVNIVAVATPSNNTIAVEQKQRLQLSPQPNLITNSAQNIIK